MSSTCTQRAVDMREHSNSDSDGEVFNDAPCA